MLPSMHAYAAIVNKFLALQQNLWVKITKNSIFSGNDASRDCLKKPTKLNIQFNKKVRMTSETILNQLQKFKHFIYQSTKQAECARKTRLKRQDNCKRPITTDDESEPDRQFTRGQEWKLNNLI